MPHQQVLPSSTPSDAPLAERMRPQTLEEILGQEHVIGPSTAFGKVVRSSNYLPSIILVGPPGVGKTTIAQVLAKTGNYNYQRLSGVLDGTSEIRKIVQSAHTRLETNEQRTLVLVDEIHRFNKVQQDAFLPHVESGIITIVGQTTENPSFRIRNALLSRLRVITLKPIESAHLKALLTRALGSPNGLGPWKLELSQEAGNWISCIAGGDARRALTALEWAAIKVRAENKITIELSDAQDAYGHQPGYFDQDSDYHYDCLSAFIKSMRGSDPEAALYYMIRALDSGEDPLIITRRMIIFASEDVGCDPRALEMALNVDKAVERIGLPEARICMAQGVVYLSMAAKSNASYKALREIERIAAEHSSLEIPRRLRNAPTEYMRGQGNAVGYKYPHDFAEGFVPERYLPEPLENLRIYHPTNRGLDAKISERLKYYDELITQENRKRTNRG